VLKAAVDLAQCSRGLNHNGSGRACGFHVHYPTRGYDEPVDHAAARFIRQHDATAS